MTNAHTDRGRISLTSLAKYGDDSKQCSDNSPGPDNDDHHSTDAALPGAKLVLTVATVMIMGSTP